MTILIFGSQEQRHETQTEKSKPTMVKQEEGQEET